MENSKTALAAALLALAAATPAAALPIDRHSVVSRNNPVVTAFDPLSSLTVGNGRFAFTVDATGLQTFAAACSGGVPLCTMSEWGWHSFPDTLGLAPEDSRKTLDLHGRPSSYAVECKDGGRAQAATQYFRVNPHRLNLARVALELSGPDGPALADPSELTDVRQELDLWDGVIVSDYSVSGVPVCVTTAVLPDRDAIVARLVSPYVASGMAGIGITFPYPTGVHSDDASTAVPTDTSALHLVERGAGYAVVRRDIGTSSCYLTVSCSPGAAVAVDTLAQTVRILPSHGGEMSFSAEFTADAPAAPLDGAFDSHLDDVARWWHDFWQAGGIVDFSECTDPRAPELERRTVLSQYLTQVNCAGSMPPQETGLTYNSWFGRPHLEMAWWHMVDFALWGRPQVMERMLRWYDDVAYDEALALARRQGFDGVRWMKMTDPQAGEAPSNVGSFLIWQQPHYIYMAEEMYRADPSEATLRRYARGVDATARFMADYARACLADGRVSLHGQTAMQESMSKDFSYAHPFEQAYWRYGLQVANRWRQRLGLDPDPEWEILAAAMAPLDSVGGIYTAGRPLPGVSNPDFALKSRSDHPAVLGACGLLPDTGLYDTGTMRATLDWVMDNWNWPTTWGWDYGMIAMAAARLGRPETAVDALLIDRGKNTYLVSGHNYQESARLRLYLPGNGSLLDAVAMMCAGWDGSTGTNPGFPADGTWRVRWEGLRPMQ